MNLIKYIISKRYREDFQNEYSSNLAKKIHDEYNQLEKLYNNILPRKYDKPS